MKRFLLICMSCVMLFSISACGKTEKADDNSVSVKTELNKVTDKQQDKQEKKKTANVTKEMKESNSESEEEENISKPEEDHTLAENADSNKEIDPYVGEYDSDELSECGYTLEIEKNNDETYHIQIGIYYVVKLYQCEGKQTEEGIVFCAPECEGKDISGIITLEGDVATVKFTSSDWSEVSDEREFTYHRTSNTPNIYVPEYKLESESLGSDADRYVGSYNSYDVGEPDLQIEKKEDGTYHIQIGIYRTINLHFCKGEQTEEGIAFSTTELAADCSGIITFVGDTATVKFTYSDELELGKDIVYRYYKTSNEPNIYEPEYE